MSQKIFFSIPYYHQYISAELALHLWHNSLPVTGIEGLRSTTPNQGLETPEALKFIVDLYERVQPDLARVLHQRSIDRSFIDERVRACYSFNQEHKRSIGDANYQTILGLQDAKGRIVAGPLTPDYFRPKGKPIARLPDFLQGPHVTLFGPPDSAKLAINAMNAFHRIPPNEPPMVQHLLSQQSYAPMWGADDEDSKTPLREDLLQAALNLTKCHQGTLNLTEGNKTYRLANDHLALPIKRFPGLALPCTFLFYKNDPIPLHLYDFALHFFHCWNNPRALTFYVPKLENEEEAAYIFKLVQTAENLILSKHPSYKMGTIRLMIVWENPRAILRANEMIDSLYPYFAGASLGWHDFLASTARLFKEDGNYRIPAKADPQIVIKYIEASHRLVAQVVGERGGVSVGGMYGLLPLPNHTDSLNVTIKGFFKDVLTQLKRDLKGFWVAHPDFVRLGLAIVEGWRQHKSGNSSPLKTLIEQSLPIRFQKEVLDFITAPDIRGLDTQDANYMRSLIVADLEQSDFIANNDPEEIRYNVFQSLQYLTDWLAGNGCVALPTVVEGVPVRVMDDLATAERSRWEIWHEVRHGRFAVEDLIRIIHEELNFIRRDLSNEKKIVQVKWDDRTQKWYSVATKILLKLLTDPNPAEFATELLFPFTVSFIRDSDDPWELAAKTSPKKYLLSRYANDFMHYFEICGSMRFATAMAKNSVEDRILAKQIITSFTHQEIVEAAAFHGNIGENKKTLDPRAAVEQSLVTDPGALEELGKKYLREFGFKFLISAKGKNIGQLQSALEERLENTYEQELANAREALWDISCKRANYPSPSEAIDELRKKYKVPGAAIAISYQNQIQSLSFGESKKDHHIVSPETRFEIASLSKTIASAFAIEYFSERGIPLSTSVNHLLAQTSSEFRLTSAGDPRWADQVTLEHLLNHTALNMHYVRGVAANNPLPDLMNWLKEVRVINPPGQKFQYSGGGFLVLQHLIEMREGNSIEKITSSFLARLGLSDFSFSDQSPCAHAYGENLVPLPGSRLNFPAFAAGAISTASDVSKFLSELTNSFHDPFWKGPISHDAAVHMLHGTDRGCFDFMGCFMGLGVFTAEAGPNRLAIHQGANDGFRALFIHCFAGPDRGKGFTILCNADNSGVLFVAEAARKILTSLQIEGIDLKQEQNFSWEDLPQEKIVNLGYKKLIFSACKPDLPEAFPHGFPDPLSSYNLVVGARIISVTNQKFARAENLLSPFTPSFDPELFGRQGKVMDSWESARHNPQPSDALHIALLKEARIRYVSLSTEFHDGNQAPKIRISGRSSPSQQWLEFLFTPMSGHSILRIDLEEPTKTFSEVKIEMLPDGGFTRLGLYEDLPEEKVPQFKPLSQAKPKRFEHPIPQTKKPLTIPFTTSTKDIASNFARMARPNLASLAMGAKVLEASNEHFGPAVQVISPFPPLHMFDGMESARSRKPGHQEHVTIQLGRESSIESIVLDFQFFINNNPVYVRIEGFSQDEWVTLIDRCEVKAFAGNQKVFWLKTTKIFSQIRVVTIPDGGINRIKVFGPAPLV